MAENFIHGHLQFRHQFFNEAEWLKQLARDGQAPHALYIGCSDSRVVPEQLTSAKAGELFVVRNIANFVPPRAHPDLSVGAAIDYALGALKVQHVIVCGHYSCGGVKAAMQNFSIGLIDNWVRHIKDVYRFN